MTQPSPIDLVKSEILEMELAVVAVTARLEYLKKKLAPSRGLPSDLRDFYATLWLNVRTLKQRATTVDTMLQRAGCFHVEKDSHATR